MDILSIINFYLNRTSIVIIFVGTILATVIIFVVICVILFIPTNRTEMIKDHVD